MSERALAMACRDELRSQFRWDSALCDCVPEPGRPPAASGEFFCSIVAAGFSNSTTESRSDAYQVEVILSHRMTYSPYDRISDELLLEQIGLDLKADRVAALIHNSYRVMNLANAVIERAARQATVYGFTEPLRMGTKTTRIRPSEWFHSDNSEPMAAYVISMRFGKALRLQSNELQA